MALSKQLAVTSSLVERYPTLGAAEAAGWNRAGPFSPGLGVHDMGPGYALNADGRMDPEDLLAPMLIFDGLTPDAKLAGFMYLAYGTTTEPEAFAGANDHWHYHEHVCIATAADGSISTPFGADLDGVTEGMSTEAGGSWLDDTGYMVHVWNVPGYESPDGMFDELNPAITCARGTSTGSTSESWGIGTPPVGTSDQCVAPRVRRCSARSSSSAGARRSVTSCPRRRSWPAWGSSSIATSPTR